MPFVPDDTQPSGHFVPDDSSASPQAAPESMLPRIVGAATEPNMQLLSGAGGAAFGGLAGLATAAGNALGLTKQQPGDVVRSVQNSLTYSPRTQGGKDAASVIGYLPQKLAQGAQYAGGKTTDLLSRLQALRGAPAAAAGAGVNTALQAIPMLFGAKPGAAALERAPALPVPSPIASARADLASGMRGGAERLMTSALKPPLSAADAIPGVVDTLLNRKINVTPGGLEKLNTHIDTLNKAIADKIQNSPAIIDKNAVASRLYDTLDKVTKQVATKSDLAAIDRIWEDFMQHPLLTGKGIPVHLAQQLKQGTYVRLRDKYGELGSAETEAQKDLARGLKEEIAKAVPEVTPLNAEDSKLLQALPLVERRVIVSANKNPISLGLIASNPKHLVAWMADRSELFKSIVAHMLNAGSRRIAPGAKSNVSPNTLRMLLGGAQATQNMPPVQ